jgi:Domain of unknown function (DUF1906)
MTAELTVLSPMSYARMADAAYAVNIPPGFPIVAGYYGGPEEFHQWSLSDWRLFPGWKLPIWVGGLGGASEGASAVTALRKLGVPPGSITVLDMEARKDVTYVEAFGAELHNAGYKTWVYGSAAFVFGNPPLNGYWVADYTSNIATIDALLQHPSVRAVQWAPDGPYDASLVKRWTEGEMWSGNI